MFAEDQGGLKAGSSGRQDRCTLKRMFWLWSFKSRSFS